jgi:GDP/UDP-N,N'-diacetylbacillosamine 2-epimerase (hydrolysing)
MNHSPPKRRRIGIFTSGRQDWSGYLLPVADQVRQRDSLDLTVFVSGTHLHEGFNSTGREIRDAGFACVDVPMFREASSSAGGELRPSDLAFLAENLARALADRPVDIVVVLGDRIETLMAAVIVAAHRCLLAHIHGGDRAPGEFDDGCRHAITKLAHVHFAATADAAQRIARLGESADRIHMTGSPGIDGILAGGVASSAEARQAVGLAEGASFVVIHQHPAGLGDEAEAAAAEDICQAVVDAGLTAVCIGPNADPGRQAISRALADFSCRHNWTIVPTVDRPVFLRLIADAVALVGNSSAGMVESAAVKAVVLNVGNRQRGREHSANVVHLPQDRRAIGQALRRLRNDEAFAASLRAAECVFGDGRAAERIVDVLAGMDLSDERRIKLNEY